LTRVLWKLDFLDDSDEARKASKFSTSLGMHNVKKHIMILSLSHLIVFGVLLLVAVSGVAIAGQAWQEEWDRVLRLAKSEGKLAMIGPLGTDRRDALTEAFQSKYGIIVEYHADAGAGILPRLSAERKAGLYLWDVLVSGTSTVLEALIPNKIVDPLEPTMILPEVKESKYWRGGGLEFLDPGRQLLVMTLLQRGTLYVNSNLVNPKEFSSYKDLLDPKWKGKIVGDDPRKSGTGQATFLFFYRHPELGADFVRALSRQSLTLLKNYAQEVDMLGQGRFPVGIGLSDSMTEERTKRGVPIVIVDPRQIKEGTPISPVSGGLSLVNRAPHPNAAKLYINWLLSKEAQTIFARATGYISNRVDVPTDHAPPWKIPQADSIKIYDLAAQEALHKLTPLLHEVFGR
jgi:iron(III) transport system substrate-binding protein